VHELTNSAAPSESEVFVVDDEVLMLSAIERVLQQAGYAVQTFSSPLEFLRAVDRTRACCVVMDLEMPEASGLEVQAALRDHTFMGTVIFLSGRADVERTVAAMRGGAVDFLTKPFEARRLVEAVGDALARSRVRAAEWRAVQDAREALANLSRREQQVARLVAAGFRSRQIAERLGTAEKTVKLQRSSLMKKLRLTSIVELVRLVTRAGPE
jgi:FixJ family two-component response regulator